MHVTKAKVIGSFNSNDHPIFDIKVYGYASQFSVPVEAMLDTGFTGFLSLPLVSCLQAGLILASTAEYTLADNSKDSTLICLGTVVLNNGKKIPGAISISKGATALLGMEFIKKLGAKLTIDVDQNLVALNYKEPIIKPVKITKKA